MKSFKESGAGAKWVSEFNDAKAEETLGKEHHCIAAYDANTVFSVMSPTEDTHFTAQGRDAVQKQWVYIRSNLKAVQITGAKGHKVVELDDKTVVQSYENVDFADAEGKYVMSIQINAEVWKLQADSQWRVMADYVTVKSASTLQPSYLMRKLTLEGETQFAKSKAGAIWVEKFNASKDVEHIPIEHHCIAAYDEKSVFSVSHPAQDVHYTVVGRDNVHKQWDTIRNAFKARQISAASGHKVIAYTKDTVVQSYDHVEFSDKDGNVVMSIQILAEVWKLQADGQWRVMADYVAVKPSVPQTVEEKPELHCV